MNKQVELIKFEIERQYNLALEGFKMTGSERYVGQMMAYESIVPFINSLPEEPVSEDLEEAAEKFAHFYDQGTCDGIAQECFKAGAKWQKEQSLTVEDIKKLDALLIEMWNRQGDNKYDEVLERFKAMEVK